MKRWQVLLGLGISALFLYFALRGMHLAEIWETVRTARVIWVLPGIPIYFFGLWLRSLRWRIFLKPIKRLSIQHLFPIIAIGYMGNNIYPARLGELVRSAILKKEDDIAISASLATIIIERIFDGIVMLGFILLNLSAISLMAHSAEIRATINTVALWGSGIFIVTFLIFLLSAFFQKSVSLFLNKLTHKILPLKFSRPAMGLMEKFFSGIQSLSSPLDTIFALLLTTAIWLVETLFYWIIMRAFPFQVSFGTLMLLNGFLNLFTIIPSSPGYIGTFDAPGIAILVALGIQPQLAAGYTLLLHAALWLPVTILGAIFFAKKGISWNEAINTAKQGRSN